MNGDSDGSEYVDEDEDVLREPNTRKKPSNSRADASKHARNESEPLREKSALSEQISKEARMKSNAIAKPKNNALRGYRDLLNSEIADVLKSDSIVEPDVIPPSQIGASCWTAQEKHKFFTALSSCGPPNLSHLSGVIGTKSEFEVQAYILLLQEGVRELNVTGKSTERFELADAPAAAEISEEFLAAEEALVAELNRKAIEQEESREKERWGEEDWLIDEEAAEAIEAALEDSSEKAVKLDGSEDGWSEGSESARSGASEGQHDSTPLSSDQLLKPATFLRLSRSIYMNSKNPELNWRTVAEEQSNDTSPSIRRTAFDDIYNLAISLTRRLVQASIFQALSRLRSSTDPRLVAAVSRHDVEAAREIVGPNVEGRRYWADAVERCGVEVYSDMRKIRADEDGRKGTKAGYLLTRDEVGAALGVKTSNAVTDASTVIDTDGEDSSADESDSDAYTIASLSEHTSSDQSDTEPEKDTISRGRTSSRSENRKRPLSPTSFDRAERRYLEKLDRIHSTTEENNLRSVLGLEALPNTGSSKPAFDYRRAAAETRALNWRETVQYESPWEQPQGYPRMSDFEHMEAQGARRRKRRRLGSEAASMREDEDDSQQDDGIATNQDTAEDEEIGDEQDGSDGGSGDQAADDSGVDSAQSDED